MRLTTVSISLHGMAVGRMLSYMACAQISNGQGRLEDALYEVDRSLIRNWHNHKARALKTHILMLMGKKEEAEKFAVRIACNRSVQLRMSL